MTVLSKLITGSLHLEAYSPLSGDTEGLSRRTTCCTKTSADAAWYLTPEANNIHQFKAESLCVVLDVLLPPYDAGKGRDCTYFTSSRASSKTMEEGLEEDDADAVWKLTVTAEEPSDLPYGVRYTGIRPSVPF